MKHFEATRHQSVASVRKHQESLHSGYSPKVSSQKDRWSFIFLMKSEHPSDGKPSKSQTSPRRFMTTGKRTYLTRSLIVPVMSCHSAVRARTLVFVGESCVGLRERFG